MWNLETNCRLAKQNGFLDIDLMLVSAFGVNIWGIILLINLRLVTNELEWGVCSVCVTLILKYTRVIRKDRVYPILNNWYDDKSKMKTMVEDRKSSRRLGDYWWSWLGCTPKKMETVSDRPDVHGDRWICGVLGASGFVQT